MKLPHCLRAAATVALLALLGFAEAWSGSPSPQQCNRKNFIREAAQASAAAVFGTATIIVDRPAEAQAATVPVGGASKQANPKVFVPDPMSLDGKVILITGASAGLGLESAKRLAAAGATTVLTARTAEKGARAIEEVNTYLTERSAGGSGRNIYCVTLDLDDLDSVRTFPQRYSQLLGSKKISVLMNNAGILGPENREMTKDGFERTFQSNHLGPFLLTAELFPYLDRTGARVINVSSRAHGFATIVSSGKGGLDMENLGGELEYTGLGWPAYGRSKLENILFTQELQRRADSAGFEWLTCCSLHPGVVGTNIWRNTYVGTKSNRDAFSAQTITSNLFYGSTLTTEEGANTQVWLSALGEDEVRKKKGLYFDENRRPKKLEKFAEDTMKARLLWERSEALLGADFKVE